MGNLVGTFFRCTPGSGSLSRSAINHQAGAVSKASGVLTAVFVGVMVLLLAPRFLSETPSTPWLAIHILRTNGKTVISFVPRTTP